MTLLDAVRDFCRQHGQQHCWIGFSGGLDSRVLLDLCYQLSLETSFVFHVVHVHHGLSPHADAWAQQCEQICRQYKFDFHLSYLNLNNVTGASIEESARMGRYQIFSDLIQKDDLLLTAHHLDDQAETMMLQLLRGAGPKGLASMPLIKRFFSGKHGRPLLSFPRQDLLQYAITNQLEWIEDESNENRALTRNFIRHEIMPALKSRWPRVEQAIARSAAHCAESQMLLEESAREKLLMMQGSKPGTLSAARLATCSDAWQRLLLRAWIEEQGFVLPDTDKMIAIQKSVLASAWDRMPCVRWGDVEVRRHRDDVYVLDAINSGPIEGEWHWDMSSFLPLPVIGALSVIPVTGRGLRADVGAVVVRFRPPGATVEVSGRGRLSLKNLFQEWRVPVWERGLVPLIFRGDKLIQAVGYFLDSAYAAGKGERGIEIVSHP